MSDNGTQFSDKLMKDLGTLLGIDLVHTTAYHPQSNGIVERMHSTLVGMLRKAVAVGLDWVDQIPFALFALRQMPCKSTGFSPYELVWGRNMRTPLDILYCGWRSKSFERLNTSEWAKKLAEKLEVLRDWAADKSATESAKRKENYDSGKSERKLNVDDKVWVRIPGKCSKFEDAWEGPFIVTQSVSIKWRILTTWNRYDSIRINFKSYSIAYFSKKKIESNKHIET